MSACLAASWRLGRRQAEEEQEIKQWATIDVQVETPPAWPTGQKFFVLASDLTATQAVVQTSEFCKQNQKRDHPEIQAKTSRLSRPAPTGRQFKKCALQLCRKTNPKGLWRRCLVDGQDYLPRHPIPNLTSQFKPVSSSKALAGQSPQLRHPGIPSLAEGSVCFFFFF